MTRLPNRAVVVPRVTVRVFCPRDRASGCRSDAAVAGTGGTDCGSPAAVDGMGLAGGAVGIGSEGVGGDVAGLAGGMTGDGMGGGDGDAAGGAGTGTGVGTGTGAGGGTFGAYRGVSSARWMTGIRRGMFMRPIEPSVAPTAQTVPTPVDEGPSDEGVPYAKGKGPQRRALSYKSNCEQNLNTTSSLQR